MDPVQLKYKNSSIAYRRFGSGPKPFICFHGYGEDATSFEFLARYTSDQFTFLCIDLPFHGKTEWKDPLPFTATDLKKIVENILHKENHEPQTINHKLAVAGFSLGGRVALSLYQSIPEKIEKIVLLAPDGLKENFWYWLATQTWMGNKFFAFTMKRPGWFFGFLKLMNKLKLVNASIFKFVNYYIGDPEVRRLLYKRWTTLRKLKPRITRIKELVIKNKTTIDLVYGEHDRIILSSVGEKFKKGIEEYCTLTVIHSGHQVLHEKHIEELLPVIKS